MWQIGNKNINSRLWLGTAQYPSLDIMQQAILTSETDIITVSMRRQQFNGVGGDAFWQCLKNSNCHILPNTAGCMNVQDAVNMAELARELFNTNWVKLEVIGDDYNLQPDPFGLLEATKILIQRGFEVFPYCTEDLVL